MKFKSPLSPEMLKQRLCSSTTKRKEARRGEKTLKWTSKKCFYLTIHKKDYFGLDFTWFGTGQVFRGVIRTKDNTTIICGCFFPIKIFNITILIVLIILAIIKYIMNYKLSWIISILAYLLAILFNGIPLSRYINPSRSLQEIKVISSRNKIIEFLNTMCNPLS